MVVVVVVVSVALVVVVVLVVGNMSYANLVLIRLLFSVLMVLRAKWVTGVAQKVLLFYTNIFYGFNQWIISQENRFTII